MEQLALRAGVSPSSLKKYFAMVYGCTTSEYIRRKRMEYVCALLKDTDQSIADIN
ncbi:AraC family transcriptional regulator [Lachnospiraceae bacterium 54-11]